MTRLSGPDVHSKHAGRRVLVSIRIGYLVLRRIEPDFALPGPSS